MTNELTKIIVKVGNRSKIKFSHCKMYRAILADDLSRISKANPDCNIVIIENISEDEQEAVKNFALEFKNSDEKHSVLFFIPDNDDITSGIADELDYNICMTLDDLYKEIYSLYNINVSTFITDKAKYNSVASESEIPSMEFGDIPEFGEILNEDDTNTKDDNFEENTETVEENNEIVEENTEPEEYSNDSTENDDIVSNDAFLALKRELNDLKSDYKQAVQDIRESNEHTKKLEDIIRVLTEEKNDIVNRFNELMSDNEVIEEPISLSEYEIVSKQLEEKISNIKELEDTIENVNNALSESNSVIENLNTEIESLKATIESDELQRSISEEYETKLSDATKYIEELEQSKTELEQSKERLVEEYTKQVADLEDKYSEITKLLNVEVNNREDVSDAIIKLLNEINSAYSKISSLEISLVEANESIAEFRDKYELANEEKENLSIENTNNISEITKLKNELESANKRAELANSYADSEKQSAEAKIVDLETNLKIVQEQLSYKETQYNSLVEQSKNSSTESITLANANSNLDMMNKTLREKLGAATKELEAYKSNKIEMSKSLEQAQAQVKRLTVALNSVSVQGDRSNITSGSIQKALYTESAQIVTVFGSGSYGVTTTAMSIANKLSATSRVLYIDFDLVAPKADAWFGKVPICRNIPGINITDANAGIKMSGLGIFYEEGIDTFIKYASSIINQCDRTKGGGIDYLSGVYYRVDANKILEADYSALLNFLGSMYQYIIIDMGRLGNSDVNDNLIKMMSDIATRNVVVTTNDKFEIRNFRTKLASAPINPKNIAWLINMCENTNLDVKTKQYLSDFSYGFMLFDSTLYGTREKFTRNKLNKDKLDTFVNTVLFASRK